MPQTVDTMSHDLNGAPNTPRPDISLPINRPAAKGEWSPEINAKLRARETSSFKVLPPTIIPRAFFPGGSRSLAGIAIRAFLLGITLGICSLLSIFLAYTQSHLWRPVFFIGTLSVFHFLEFWTTAEYNTPSAVISSYLLTNGDRYRQAHTFALLESFITSYFFPAWQSRINPPWVIAIGIGMILVGQVVRSMAMARAGTNFNHQVQSQKNEGHELVTTGIYGVLRHPSYFGFFWWGLGTQVMLGNCISFVGYAGVLWYFFKTRIRREEKHLVEFFGEDYKAYRSRTRVWIPFIR